LSVFVRRADQQIILLLAAICITSVTAPIYCCLSIRHGINDQALRYVISRPTNKTGGYIIK